MTNSDDTAKKKALELAISHIEKQFGEGAIMSLGDHSINRSIQAIKTGSIALDIALGIGGVPRGRIVEIYGPESSGKSTLATHIVANCQKENGSAVYIDTEHALDGAYASRIGVNLKNLMISQPDCGEDALNIAEVLARSNAVDLIVIDSVAALVPRSELQGEIGDTHIGLQARLMSQALRKLTAILAKSNTCAIFINQIRQKIGVMFGNPETTPGGLALKFYCSTRIELRPISAPLKGTGIEGNTNIGRRIKAKIVKNKVAAPLKTAEFDIMFNEGISRIGSLIDVGVEYDIIEKKGAWYSYQDKRLGQGKEATREELKKFPDLADEIEERIMKKAQGEETEPLQMSELKL